MNPRDARALLDGAIPTSARRGDWADFGAGEGTFTRALAELIDGDRRIYAVDSDDGAIAALRMFLRDHTNVIPVAADFSGELALPELTGLLFANSLHYLKNADIVLARLVGLLDESGRVVVIEYDRRGPNQWVPYPIPIARIGELFSNAGLSTPTITAKRPSRYGGDLYVATATRGFVRLDQARRK
jgi:SAM-dependent methyltransferase